jgi:hypothetical protein
MFIVNGVVLVLVGIFNIVATVIGGGEAVRVVGWFAFGVFQILLGVNEIRKFRRFASLPQS